MRYRHWLVLLSMLFAMGTVAQAQVIYNFGNYTQNFNGLANTGSGNTFTNNSTITGWYANQTSYEADDGTGNTNGLYSYGSVGQVDRALGSIAANQAGVNPVQYGVQIFNNTTDTFTKIDISFVGEQWRNAGGNRPNTITFDWLLTNSNANQLTAAGYTAAPSLDWSAPTVGPPASSMDGNLPANQVPKSASFLNTIVFQPGQYLWLRWTDVDDQNPDCGLAIDTFGFSASVPEPAVMVIALLALLTLAGFTYQRMQRKLTPIAVATTPQPEAGEYNEFQ